MKRTIRLPNGQSVTLATYCQAWKAIARKPEGYYSGFDYFPTRGTEILEKIQFGVHDRINRHLPHYGRGRKWDDDWQRAAIQTARSVNTPRLLIHWLPVDLRSRLSHRLADAA